MIITKEKFVELALSFPETAEKPHFQRIGFKVKGKKMFATYFEKDHTANIFLTPAEQAVFCQSDTGNIYPVPNKWGEKGATTFNLKNLSEEWVLAALHSAYNTVLRIAKNN